MEIYKCSTDKIPHFYLIDTPGFDDSHRTDTDILRELANWLTQAFEKDIKLTGIIYLHRIQDVRLGGAGMKNLRMFKKLCGESSLSSVVLATTFWSKVTAQEGEQREKELSETTAFWGNLIAHGSKVFRQDRDQESAEEIINYLVERRKDMVLDIQREMVTEKKTLEQTSAGGEVQAELLRAQAEYERKLQEMRADMKEAMAERDRAWQEEIKKSQRELEDRMRQDAEDRRKLEADAQQLQLEREREREEERRQWAEERLEAQRKAFQYERELEQQKTRHAHEMELAVIRRKLELEEQKVQMLKEKEESSCLVM